jgi:hypothetical protein
MDVESPHVALSQQRADTLRSLVAQSPPIDISSHDQAGGVRDDDVINVAYDEVRRSVSPQVAEYIFKPRIGQTSPGSSGPAKAGWSVSSILSIPLAEPELMRLTQENLSHLAELAENLWELCGNEYLDCIGHIGEILLARESSSRSEDMNLLARRSMNLSLTYLRMGRMADSEILLTNSLHKIESLRPGSSEGSQFRVLLAILYSVQGQHSLAEELCTKAMLFQRSTLGLNNSYTWRAYYTLGAILRVRNKFDEERKLMMDFYLDVYYTLSNEFLPGLHAALAVCRNCIEVWMTESKLQGLMRIAFVCDRPLGIAQRTKLALSTIFRERLKEDIRLGVVPQLLKDFSNITSIPFGDILSSLASLIVFHIQTIQCLESSSLQQEALRVANEFKVMKFLVPLWIFAYLNEVRLWQGGPNWRAEEQEFIHSLEDAVAQGGHSVRAPHSSMSTETGSLRSALTVSNDLTQIEMFNGLESVTVLPVAGQDSSPEASLQTNGLYHHTSMPTTVSSPILAPPRPRPTSSTAELSRLDDINPLTSHSTVVWNTEPYSSYQWSTSEMGHHLNDARSHGQFEPTMVNNPTPPFTSSFPLTPHATQMPPPPRPGQESPAAAPSSVVIGRPDVPTPPNLFGLPHSSLSPSPSLGSGPSPGP